MILPVLEIGYLGCLALAGLAAASLGACRRAEPPTPTRASPPHDIPLAPDAGIRPRLTGGYPVLPRQCGEPRRPYDIALMQGINALPTSGFSVPQGLEAEIVLVADRNGPQIREQILESILGPDSPQAPQIVAFGETHPLQGYSGRQPIEAFLLLLPILIERNYRHIALEYLPSDFSGLTEIPQNFASRLPLPTRMPLTELLEALLRTGIRAYGCGGTIQEISEYLHRFTSIRSLEASQQMGAAINRDALLWLDELAQDRNGTQRVLFYGGLSHVSPFPSIEWRPDSVPTFGPELVRRGYAYLAVGIITPSQMLYFLNLIRHQPRPQEHNQLSQTLWYLDRHGLIPTNNRVNVVRVRPAAPGENRPTIYYIVFPFEP